VPADGHPWPPIGRNGNFGTSPFFRQLFGQTSAGVYTNSKRAAGKEQ
jgi:hypothetical protein